MQNMSVGRQEAFEIFKRDYAGNIEIEDQKRFLKKSYGEAKMLGEVINTTRNKLSELTAKFRTKYICLTFSRYSRHSQLFLNIYRRHFASI